MKKLVIVLSLAAAIAYGQDAGALKRQIGIADYYVKEFEKEVALQRGGEKQVWRSKKDALQRVQQLKQSYPNDPEVEALFQRTKKALAATIECIRDASGRCADVASDWTDYKNNEEKLRQIIAEESAKEWNKLMAGKDVIKTFPTPDSSKITVDELKGSLVVLDDIQYPANQFYGVSGEYIATGSPSQGFYFLSIGGRDWLGPYEAVKRYRRNVNSSMLDVQKWTVLGEIVNITAENPRPSEDAVGNVHFGWVVKPLALYVPNFVMAVYKEDAPYSGIFIAEDRVEELKNSFYTYKSVPNDVSPEKLAEIFMYAIKEKNYALYEDCIDPERQKGAIGKDLLRYHWDLHQERFKNEYIHATFGKAKLTVAKGFDQDNDLENFFLDEGQKQDIKKISGERLEFAEVESTAYDKNGKQLGTPHPRKLIRRGGGRWYIYEYEQRF